MLMKSLFEEIEELFRQREFDIVIAECKRLVLSYWPLVLGVKMDIDEV